MNSIDRRRAIVTGAALISAPALVLPRFARAAEFTYKFGTNLPATHPLNVRAMQAAERILKDTGGQVQINVFPNNQLGNDADMLSQLRAGGLEFFTVSGVNVLSQLVPVSSMWGLGFAWANDEAVNKALDGDLGKFLRAQFPKVGLMAMDTVWSSGFRQITNSVRPINTPDDLKGLKIRVPVSPLWTSLFKHLGAAPTSINFAETYSSLQTKVVDGQENPLAIISIAKLYEVQKYCSMTNHMWDGYWCMTNQKVWSRMPEKVRPIIAKHLNQAALDMRADGAKLDASLRPELTSRGLAFNDPEIGPFRARLLASGFYAEWKKKYGDEAWALLEKHTGKLG
ncbi:TRAP dicarboxylate transporter, DctP subunit [Delftia acidovorans SPH-1]|uniref:TRAP dicarboxylate transporter, DctP subunit n=1 Tax=Delftia acidovorans (strain DSM 14801 / SPH-1) TaxID=398578 RepID=A9BXJ7_DELAS|nr:MULTISPECIES: TRAP transporter substrate-binding protein [Delftia]MCP4017847.1 TRAP transporter substrate-binding protein [Delftia sp.]OLE94151.1 MAG: ABC transporter substrate-binding protein [Delftia sp. 13_1_40CM_3_66_6]ABX38273.1 TRAP dicarboxylate transporter, DctP subunit [Delftia acidovorans SPH-1]MBD9584261.1 TRAP transporter substrate-binding protein [Delftia sp. DLF01]MBO0986008.1 TRAP transporter substrate-binding protein [Delftia sp. SD083]